MKYDLELKYSCKRTKSRQESHSQNNPYLLWWMEVFSKWVVGELSPLNKLPSIGSRRSLTTRYIYTVREALLKSVLQNTPFVVLFSPRFLISFFVPSCAIVCHYLWESTPWSHGSHLRASNHSYYGISANIQKQIPIRFEIRKYNSLLFYKPLIIIVFTSITPSQRNRRCSPQRKIVFIKLCVNVPTIYKITNVVFWFNFSLENNLSM